MDKIRNTHKWCRPRSPTCVQSLFEIPLFILTFINEIRVCDGITQNGIVFPERRKEMKNLALPGVGWEYK